MNLKSAVRAILMRSKDIPAAIAERARRCPRATTLAAECGIADYEYWENLAVRFVYKNPECADAWTVLGHSRIHLNDRQAALKAYRVAAPLKNSADAWFSLGCVAQGEEQITSYRKALELNPKHESSWHCLGNALADGGSYDDAIRCFRTALECSNDSSAAWVLCDLGLCYLATQQLQDSAAVFEQSVRADGGYAFRTMAANIADSCVSNETFAQRLYSLVVPISPHDAEFFLRCWTSRAQPNDPLNSPRGF